MPEEARTLATDTTLAVRAGRRARGVGGFVVVTLLTFLGLLAYEDADPRLLFYMVLIHEALGSSSSVKSSEPDAKPTKTMPFFSHYAIEREISKLVTFL